MKAIKLQTITSCWRKLLLFFFCCLYVTHAFPEFTAELTKEIMEKLMDMATKVAVMGEGFQDMGSGEIQVLIDTTPEALTEDDLMEMSTLEPVPDDEEEDADEAVPEKS